MADFVALTDLETNAKKPIRQALAKKLKDNFDNHEGRIVGLETKGIALDHFTDYQGRSFDVSGDFSYQGNNSVGGGGTTTGQHSRPQRSVGRMGDQAPVPITLTVAGAWMMHTSRWTAQFTDDGEPMIFEAHLRHNDRNLGYFIGWYDATGGLATFNHFAPLQDGVYIQRVDSTNWKFISRFLSSQTDGASFGSPANDSWYDVKIEFKSGPDRVLTSIDTGGGLTQIDDFRTDLPLSIPLRSLIGVDFQVVSGGLFKTFDLDRVKLTRGEGVLAT